ncbi:MAG: TMEM175 family protein [Nitrososphaerales archaeon]
MMDDERASTSSDERGLGRILSLSDGIFAFAITLLVLNLVVPSLGKNVSSINLLTSLGNQITQFASYGESFVIISVYWVAHHRVPAHKAVRYWLDVAQPSFLTLHHDNPLLD